MERLLVGMVATWSAIALLVSGCGNDVGVTEFGEDSSPPDISATLATAASVMAQNHLTHEDDQDYRWDLTNASTILMEGTTVSSSSPSVVVAGTTVTITAGGTYRISGNLDDGQVVVDAADEGTVYLVLSGVTIGNASTAPIVVSKAAKVVVVLEANSSNVLTDASSYVFPSSDEEEPNAALFSKADLTICGNGSLTVTGRYNDGIASKDGLIIKDAAITVSAVDDGIRGKDYLVLKGALLTITSGGDALKSDNTDDPTRGFVYVESGTIHATSGGDAIAASSDAVVAGGELDLISGGGSGRTVSGTHSAKGLKGTVCVVVENGVFSLNTADDAVHSNGSIVINGGTFAISTGDDGMHADTILGINNGSITIAKCYEGIESTTLVINGGTIRITASDDAINGAGGVDGSGKPGWPGGMPPTGNCYLYVTGGYVAATAAGDGLDINGTIVMSGGTVLVHGPATNMEGAIDYDRSYTMTGGFVAAAGSAGMAQAPGTTSSQCALLVTFGTTKAAGTIFHIQAANGGEILTFQPTKPYQSIVFSSSSLIKGSSYDVYLGGTSSGTPSDGLYTGGTFSGGVKSASFTITGILTRIGM